MCRRKAIKRHLSNLTSVDYNDGLANEYREWGYDAAGNRTADSAYSTGSWVYDNLNRMTDSPKVHGISGSGSSVCWYTNDILGNRTSRNDSTTSSDVGAARYGWDKLGRMLYAATPSGGSSDYYRADGQRIEKVANASLSWTQWTRTSGQYDLNFATSGASTRYFYDGQMGFEDDYNPSGSVTVVNRYGLGARGIDRIERTENSSTTYGYPLYDGHGNMRTTLARNGTGYSTGTFKTYDVWGSVRSGGDSGDPTQKYCASLGHVSEDDNGLIYMRARYHEPSTGRFISEDPARDGWNWYSYCSNDPANHIDKAGRVSERQLNIWLADLLADCFVSPEARIVLSAFVIFWILELGVMDQIFKFQPQFRKRMFVMECETIALTDGVVGSVTDRARAEARTYSIGLQVTAWILLGDLWGVRS